MRPILFSRRRNVIPPEEISRSAVESLKQTNRRKA